MFFTMLDSMPPSLSNCSAQYADLDASLFANEFVMRALVHVLEAAPSAYVVDQNMVEIGIARPNIIEQLD